MGATDGRLELGRVGAADRISWSSWIVPPGKAGSVWYGVSAGSGRLAVDPRSGTPGGRIGRGEWIGLDASGEENGRENNGSVLDDDGGGILGDCGRGCCTAREGWKCILGAGDSVKSIRSIKSGTEPRAAFGSPPIDVGGEDDDDGVLSEDELATWSSNTGLAVSVLSSEVELEARHESRGGGSESCTTAEPGV